MAKGRIVVKSELCKGCGYCQFFCPKDCIEMGGQHFFGYPSTPQNDIPEYMSEELPKLGGIYKQTESEVSSMNMVYGAVAAGVRAMTSTSSPGFSLMQEAISGIAAAELPDRKSVV